MNKRMLEAAIALLGAFVASYLALYKLGYIGTLACGAGSCETVQLSRWASFLGIPVAVWGVAFYGLVLGLAMLGLQDRFIDSRGVALALTLVTGWGLIFSAWLTYVELFIIHAICRWCVASATLTSLLFVVAAFDLREVHLANDQAEGDPDATTVVKPEEITPV